MSTCKRFSIGNAFCSKKMRHILCASLPSNCAALLIVNLDKLAEAAGVVVVGCFSVPESLREKKDTGVLEKKTIETPKVRACSDKVQSSGTF